MPAEPACESGGARTDSTGPQKPPCTAVHAATGSGVPTNEEWHYRPPEVQGRIPLRAVVKWRINTLAGFEGGTKIHINTIDPWTLRDRVASAMGQSAAEGRIATGVRVIRP